MYVPLFFAPEFIKGHEEQMTNSFLYDLATQMYAYSTEKKAPEDAIFEAEKKWLWILWQKKTV